MLSPLIPMFHERLFVLHKPGVRGVRTSLVPPPVRYHGVWQGELAVSSDAWDLAEVDPMARQNLHVQNVCRATMDGKTGWGVLEQIAVGPHRSGLTGLLDPYQPG